MSNQDTAPTDNIPLGIACACLTFFLLTVMLALGKLIANQHNAIEIVFYRNAVPASIMLLYILARQKHHLLKTKKPRALLFRVIIGTIAIILTFGAMQELPMANATVLFFASTLIIPIMSYVFLKERITLHRWVSVLIGLVGVVLIAQPSLELTILGVTLALGAAFGHAVIQIMLRYLKSEHPFTITFYFLLSGVIICGAAMPWIGHMPTAYSAKILLLLGITGGLTQYLLTFTFRLAPASVINPFNYTGLIWAVGLDILIWNVIPSWHIYAGAAIIIGSYAYMILQERKNERV